MQTLTFSITAEKASVAPITKTIEEDSSLEIVVEAGAKGAVCLLIHAEHVEVTTCIAEGGSMHLCMITLSKNAEHSVQSKLEGPNATSDIDWMFYARGSDLQKLSAQNVFAAEDGGGEIVMKGVAEGKARVQCDGLIAISENGKGTDTYLHEDVLMLDKTAKVNAVPGLEIKTNDVKASHSATVSKVTSEDLFYFASRGIAEEEARQMYVLGFLGALTQKIAHQESREMVIAAVEKKHFQ